MKTPVKGGAVNIHGMTIFTASLLSQLNLRFISTFSEHAQNEDVCVDRLDNQKREGWGERVRGLSLCSLSS